MSEVISPKDKVQNYASSAFEDGQYVTMGVIYAVYVISD